MNDTIIRPIEVLGVGSWEFRDLKVGDIFNYVDDTVKYYFVSSFDSYGKHYAVSQRASVFLLTKKEDFYLLNQEYTKEILELNCFYNIEIIGNDFSSQKDILKIERKSES